MSRHYLDANATAPLRPEARAMLRKALDGSEANASSVHRDGQRARAAIDAARREVAALLGAFPHDVLFTGSGSEANNLAIFGAVAAAGGRSHVVTSALEHPSVLEPVAELARRGYDVTVVRPGRDGVVRAEAVLDAVRPGRTALVSLTLANHEIGTLQPVQAVADGLRGTGVPLHTDAAQAAGRIPVDMAALGVDLLSLAAHKLGGPQGTGALVARPHVPLTPHVRGGGQERGLRAGTENVALIAAFGAAAAAARAAVSVEGARLQALRDRLENEALALDGGVAVNGGAAPRLPNTSSLALPGLRAEEAVIALDLEGVMVSAGAACSSGTVRPSPALLAMGCDAEARGSIRVSLSHDSDRRDVEAFLTALGALLARRRDRPAGMPAVRARAV
jgi:cysteine desulfurase